MDGMRWSGPDFAIFLVNWNDMIRPRVILREARRSIFPFSTRFGL
jgi:hypothetical protein